MLLRLHWSGQGSSSMQRRRDQKGVGLPRWLRSYSRSHISSRRQHFLKVGGGGFDDMAVGIVVERD